MFSKSVSSMLVVFFMISVVFAGCLDDEEIEENLSDESVKGILVNIFGGHAGLDCRKKHFLVFLFFLERRGGAKERVGG